MSRFSGRHVAIAAYTVLVCVFLVLPIVILVPVSFSSARSYSFPPAGFSLRWYEDLVTVNAFGQPALLSLGVGIAATVISVVLGTMVAFGLARVRPLRRTLGLTLFSAPLLVPNLIYGVAMMLFLTSIGLTRSVAGLIVAHAIITLPYVVRSVAAALTQGEWVYEEAALTLGASPWMSFWLVSLPLMRPGIVAGAIFGFIVSFDNFSMSLFLVSSGQVTLPVAIFQYVENQVDPVAAAISCLLVGMSFAIVMVIHRTYGLERFLSGGK